jgi:hypothetical protein
MWARSAHFHSPHVSCNATLGSGTSETADRPPRRLGDAAPRVEWVQTVAERRLFLLPQVTLHLGLPRRGRKHGDHRYRLLVVVCRPAAGRLADLARRIPLAGEQRADSGDDLRVLERTTVVGRDRHCAL